MPTPESADSPLERLRKRLYAPVETDPTSVRAMDEVLLPKAESWTHEDAPVILPKKRVSAATVFFVAAAGFCLLAGITTAIVLFLGGRSVSSDNVELVVDVPPIISGGEEVALAIVVRNGNPLPISDASVTLALPEGTTIAGEAATHYVEEVGTVASGETVERTVRVSFLGAENQTLTVPATLEYKTGNSSATFQKKEQDQFVISNAPVSISVTTLSEVSSSQPFTLVLSVRSNAKKDIENVAILPAKYPSGFTVTSAEPAAGTDGLFVIGKLAPGEEKEIRITGTLVGQEGEERVFRFTSGTLKSADSRVLGVSYMTTDTKVVLAKPFLSVGLTLNREDDESIVVRAGTSIQGALSWANALSSTVENASVSVALSGDALDTGTVGAVGGFYRSSDRTILFSRDTSPGLAALAPGATGSGSFSFQTKTGAAMEALRTPTITMVVSVSGRRVGENNVGENVSSTVTRTIRIASDLTLTAQTLRTKGAFTNTGPWPPVADSETTYTIQLDAKNTVNSVGGAKATMILPSYVRYTGQTSGSGVTYDAGTRTVTWNIGDVAAAGKATASFQVALLPSVSQKGTSPVLVSDLVITGVDRFVQQEVGGASASLTTRATTDPGFQDSFGTVQ